MAQARDVYELHIEERPPRRRRLRFLASLVAGAVSEGAFAPEPVVSDVRILRARDGSVALAQAGVSPDVVALLRTDWQELSVEEFEQRWLRDDGVRPDA